MAARTRVPTCPRGVSTWVITTLLLAIVAPAPDIDAQEIPTLVADVAVSETIESISDVDPYTFTLATATRVVLQATGAAGVLDPCVRVLTGVSGPPVTGGTTCGVTARLDLTLSPGTYFVEVSDSFNNQTGPYALLYQPLAVANAVPLTADTPVSSTISPIGDLDLHTFTLATATRVVLQATGASNVVDPCVRVLTGVSGPPVTGGTTCGVTARLDLTLSPGTYFVEVSDSFNNQTGPYALLYQPLAVANAVPLTADTPVSSTISPIGDLDLHTFTLATATRVVLQATGASNVVDPCVRVLTGVSGPPVTGGTTCGVTARLDLTLSPGTYFVEVSDSFNNQTGPYALLYQPLAVANAVPLTADTPVSSTISPIGDLDLHTFTLATATRVVLQATGASNVVDPCVRVLTGVSGPPVTGGTTCGVTARLDLTLSPGTYFVEVSDSFNNQTGPYTLLYQPLAVSNAVPLTADTPVSSTISPIGDLDLYTFTLPAAQPVVLQATGAASVLDPCLRVLTGAGGTPVTGGTTCGVTARLDLALAAGTYFVEVSDSFNNQSGPYTIAYQPNVATPPPTSLPLDAPRAIAVIAGTPLAFDITVPGGAPNLFIRLQKDAIWRGTLTLLLGATQVATVAGVTDHILQVPAPAAGTFRLLVTGSGAGSGVLTASTSLPSLTLGQPTVGAMRRQWGNAWYQVDVPASQSTLSFSVEMLGVVSRIDVWFGEIGGAPRWAAWGDRINLQIPSPGAGRYFVQLFDSATIIGASQARDHRILADVVATQPSPCTTPLATSLTPDRGATGFVTMTVSGQCLQGASRLCLTRPGQQSVCATGVMSSDVGRALTGTFDLAGVASGQWHVGLDDTPIVPSMPFTVEQSGRAELQLSILGRSVVRAGRPTTFTAAARNVGSIDLRSLTAVLPRLEVLEPLRGVPLPISAGLLIDVLPPQASLTGPIVITPGPGCHRLSLTPEDLEDIPCDELDEMIRRAEEELAEINRQIAELGCICEPRVQGPPSCNGLCQAKRTGEHWLRVLREARRRCRQQENRTSPPAQAALEFCAVTSISPEDKYGPAGHDASGVSPDQRQRWIRATGPVSYRIDFWNKEDAPAPTQDVVVTDALDADLDWSTFVFTEIGFLRWRVPLEPTQYFNVDVDLRPDFNLVVNVEATFDPETGQIEWRFRSLDPLTREPPDDPFAGFLPPITSSGYEIGWVEFSVSPRAGLPTGTEITNQSFVKFDVDVFKPAPPAGPFLNTLDASRPASAVQPLAVVQSITGFRVQWAGTDVGAGVRDYTVSVSTNGAPFVAWQPSTTATSAVFPGQRGAQYAFHVVAHDQAGNAEGAKTVAEATTSVSPTAFMDGDLDGMSDEWETQYGLNPLSDAVDDGATGDPDGDGVTNMEEYAAGTDPTLANTVTLAEGATGVFFEERIALANPAPIAARVTMTFLQLNAAPIERSYDVPAQQRITVVVNDIPGLESADVSAVVTTTQGGVAVERTMTWDRASRYGGHTGKAVRAPRTEWYLAEGEANFFDTFILFTNANAAATNVTATYLLDNGSPITRTYVVNGNARLTIRTNDDQDLRGRPFSTTVTSTLPITVDRAMYFSAGGVPYTGGHAASAVEQPSSTWFVAEGATGEFFDEFLLLANPNATSTTATVRYLTTDGRAIERVYELPATSRTTVYVDGVPGLENVAGVSAAIDASAPIIVERAMYWPRFPWYEAHTSAGVTATGTRWVLAEGETGGALAYATYVLLANAGNVEATVTMTFLRSGRPPLSTTLTVPAHSRVTRAAHDFALEPGEQFGVLVVSSHPIAVERAMYWNGGGVFWGAGTNETGVRMR